MLKEEKRAFKSGGKPEIASYPASLTEKTLDTAYMPKVSEKRELLGIINNSQSFNTASNNQTMSSNVLSNNHQEESTDNILHKQESLHVRKMKLMSKLLMTQHTPKQVDGSKVDPKIKSLMSSNKKKVLGLKIEVNEPEYDEEGKLIHKEEFDDDDEGLDNFDGIFNAHLLDEEVLDQ